MSILNTCLVDVIMVLYRPIIIYTLYAVQIKLYEISQVCLNFTVDLTLVTREFKIMRVYVPLLTISSKKEFTCEASKHQE